MSGSAPLVLISSSAWPKVGWLAAPGAAELRWPNMLLASLSATVFRRAVAIAVRSHIYRPPSLGWNR